MALLIWFGILLRWSLYRTQFPKVLPQYIRFGIPGGGRGVGNLKAQ